MSHDPSIFLLASGLRPFTSAGNVARDGAGQVLEQPGLADVPVHGVADGFEGGFVQLDGRGLLRQLLNENIPNFDQNTITFFIGNSVHKFFIEFS